MVDLRVRAVLAFFQVFAASLPVFFTRQQAVTAWVTFSPAHVPSRFPSSRKPITAAPSFGAPARRVSMSYTPKDIQEAWDNHFASFGAKDVDRILLDYDENSQVTTYDQTTGDLQSYKGIEQRTGEHVEDPCWRDQEGVRLLFDGLFAALTDQSDLAAPVINVDEDSKTVFLVWRCPASGFLDATDTFVFDDNKKIYRQTVVIRTA